jgi:hypothetical protein
MKTIITQISLIILSIVLILILTINAYIFLITYKLSECQNYIERMQVVCKYKIFSHIWFGTASMIFTIILLGLMLYHVMRLFGKNKKEVYQLTNY